MACPGKRAISVLSTHPFFALGVLNGGVLCSESPSALVDVRLLKKPLSSSVSPPACPEGGGLGDRDGNNRLTFFLALLRILCREIWKNMMHDAQVIHLWNSATISPSWTDQQIVDTIKKLRCRPSNYACWSKQLYYAADLYQYHSIFIPFSIHCCWQYGVCSTLLHVANYGNWTQDL